VIELGNLAKRSHKSRLDETTVLAALVERLSYKEPIFDLPDPNVSMGAAFGLMALKEKAVPVLPQLRRLMNSEDEGLALRAMIATIGSGKDAASCVMAGLTNEHPVVRSEAAAVLSSDWSAQSADVREMAKVEIIKLLEDPDHDVIVSAANALWEMDRKLALKVGIKPMPSVVHR
jgi:HEAT repeat protein